MKSLSVIAGAFLLIAAQPCSIAGSKINAQATVKTVNKDEPKTVKLKITGMTCAGCSNQVATTLKALDGVVEQKVEYPGDLATIKYDPAKTSVAEIIKAIEKIGYKAVAVSEKAKAKQS